MACVHKSDGSLDSTVMRQSSVSKLYTYTRKINIFMILVRAISGTTQKKKENSNLNVRLLFLELN